MGIAGPNAAGAATDDAGTGTISWANTGNVLATDATYATASLTSGQTTHYLKATSFGFSIPANARIDGIRVDIQRNATAGSTLTDARVRIVQGGVIGSTDKSKSAAWTTSNDYFAYGGEGELWGLSWTDSDINSSNFGAALSVTSSGTATANVDFIRIWVFYSMQRTSALKLSRARVIVPDGESSSGVNGGL